MALPLVEDVRATLQTEHFGQSMRGFDTVGSTNSIAEDWARTGAAEGSVVVTEYQSAGKGRQGRTWEAKKGQNLMFSVVLHPDLATDRLSLITVAASVAVAEAIESFVSPHRPALKWPNDVLLEGRKTCGMLLESSISGHQKAEVVVLGVGLNVNQTTFPPDLSDDATSLRLTTGRPVPRPQLFSRLLAHLEERYYAVLDGNDGGVRSAFEDRLVGLGQSTTLRRTNEDTTISGVVQGITETGALRLETSDGVTTVHAGNVTSQT